MILFLYKDSGTKISCVIKISPKSNLLPQGNFPSRFSKFSNSFFLIFTKLAITEMFVFWNFWVVSDRLPNGRKEKQAPDIFPSNSPGENSTKGRKLSTEKFDKSFYFFCFPSPCLTATKFEKSRKPEFVPKSITFHVLPTREQFSPCRNIVSRHIKSAQVISVFNNFSALIRRVRWVRLVNCLLLRF